MDIAYITHYYPPSGGAASLNTYEIIKRLAARGHKIVVFAPSKYAKYIQAVEKEKLNPNMRVYKSLPVPLVLSFTLSHLFNLKKLITEPFDVVISQFHPFHFASFCGFVGSVVRKKRWLIRVHDFVIDPSIHRPLYEKIYTYFQYLLHMKCVNKYADKILVISSESRDFLQKSESYPLDKIVIVPNGVDTKTFRPSRRYKKDKTILYIGSMFTEDGLDILIEAFSLIKPKSGSRLLLVGDGPDRRKLEEMVTTLKLENDVTFRRYIPHSLMPDIIRSSCVGIGPLYPTTENFFTIPTKILEYFACGVPVISCRISSDILVDNYTGLVVSNPTPENVAEKISFLMNDEKLTRRLGANAHELIVNKFRWEIVIDKLEKELEETIGK